MHQTAVIYIEFIHIVVLDFMSCTRVFLLRIDPVHRIALGKDGLVASVMTHKLEQLFVLLAIIHKLRYRLVFQQRFSYNRGLQMLCVLLNSLVIGLYSVSFCDAVGVVLL